MLRCDNTTSNNWLSLRTRGTKSNRSGIGARLKLEVETKDKKTRTLIDEVRSVGSYYSQNDLRLHFGLGEKTKVDRIRIYWPSGQVEVVQDVAANQLAVIKEGSGLVTE